MSTGTPNVFVSSTVFDLIDIRAEVREMLKQLGITPIMSDYSLSDFEIDTGKNSIQNCLVNVAKCDDVIFIIDKRYGRTLEKFGFDGISATHLEYRESIRLGKKIHFFIRDQTEADLAVWKKSKKDASIHPVWVSDLPPVQLTP